MTSFINWKTACDVSPGVSHQKQKIPCQDYADYYPLNLEVIIGAVADGAGSAKYAEIGAKLAVKETITYLTTNYQEISSQLSPIEKNIAQEIFSNVVKNILKTFEIKAQENKCLVKDYACTFITFIVTPTWIAAMQIGDGLLVVRLDKDKDYQLVFQPDKGEYINETTFITSKNALETMQIKVITGNQKFICASTDGLERVSIHFSNGHPYPYPPFFEPLENYLAQTDNSEQDKEYLKNFLDSERLNAVTNDDKTLLICLYSNSDSDQVTEVKNSLL